MDGLEPLLADKVLPVMVETEVSRLVPKPGENRRGSSGLRFVKQLFDSVAFHLDIARALKHTSHMCIVKTQADSNGSMFS